MTHHLTVRAPDWTPGTDIISYVDARPHHLDWALLQSDRQGKVCAAWYCVTRDAASHLAERLRAQPEPLVGFTLTVDHLAAH